MKGFRPPPEPARETLAHAALPNETPPFRDPRLPWTLLISPRDPGKSSVFAVAQGGGGEGAGRAPSSCQKQHAKFEFETPSVGGPWQRPYPLRGFLSRGSHMETSGPGLGRAEARARGLNLRTPYYRSLSIGISINWQRPVLTSSPGQPKGGQSGPPPRPRKPSIT
jgi:hypothetical protein